jgi:hypothetical protein
MRRDSVSGVVLIAGAASFVLVMAIHPTAHGLMREETFARAALFGRMVHALALAATPVVFLGLLGAARRLAPSDLSVAGLVAFGFGSVAVMTAALASGFIFPGVVASIRAAEESNVPHAFLVYTSLWNRSSAAVHVVAFAAGTLLLAAGILRHRNRLPMPLTTGVSGIAAGVLVLGFFLTGHVGLDVHGARILWYIQTAWLIWLGIVMCVPGKPSSAVAATLAP